MANSVGTRPMILDTVTADPVRKGWVKISSLQYDGYTAGNDEVILENQDGVVIYHGTGNADLSPITLTNVRWVKGLWLTTITAGVLRVYVD